MFRFSIKYETNCCLCPKKGSSGFDLNRNRLSSDVSIVCHNIDVTINAKVVLCIHSAKYPLKFVVDDGRDGINADLSSLSLPYKFWKKALRHFLESSQNTANNSRRVFSTI